MNHPLRPLLHELFVDPILRLLRILIPSWAKDSSVAAQMINARSETADTKPAFRDALKSRRCLPGIANSVVIWNLSCDGGILRSHFGGRTLHCAFERSESYDRNCYSDLSS
jgi:hypothetical protein